MSNNEFMKGLFKRAQHLACIPSVWKQVYKGGKLPNELVRKADESMLMAIAAAPVLYMTYRIPANYAFAYNAMGAVDQFFYDHLGTTLFGLDRFAGGVAGVTAGEGIAWGLSFGIQKGVKWAIGEKNTVAVVRSTGMVIEALNPRRPNASLEKRRAEFNNQLKPAA